MDLEQNRDREALDRIGVLYDIERDITGQSAGIHLAVRHKRSKPKVEAFGLRAGEQLTPSPDRAWRKPS